MLLSVVLAGLTFLSVIRVRPHSRQGRSETMMPGPIELVVLMVVALPVFGPKRLPELGKSLGSGMRTFKDSLSGEDENQDPATTRKT